MLALNREPKAIWRHDITKTGIFRRVGLNAFLIRCAEKRSGIDVSPEPRFQTEIFPESSR